MRPEHTLHVRLIDGTDCFVAVESCANSDGTFLISANPEFDPEDTSTVPEFLPGDTVRAETRAPFTHGQAPVLIATELVRTSADDRDYWSVLFALASGAAGLPALRADRLAAIAARVLAEVASGSRWHYPSVVNWANGSGTHTGGA